jgi:hypothetical protein
MSWIADPWITWLLASAAAEAVVGFLVWRAARE